MSRAISAAVNSPDDYGCILGNWTDEFEGGTQPTKWIGSMEIMQAYFKKKKPVKYGQCWVFAGVITTSMRFLKKFLIYNISELQDVLNAYF